jgi:hypothetical protein
MSETMHRSRTSPTQRVRARASAIGPGSNDRCELANSDPEANCRSAPSILTLTLELVALFLVISFVAALLATHFGWLNPANARSIELVTSAKAGAALF